MKLSFYFLLLCISIVLLLERCKHDSTDIVNPFPPYNGTICFSSDIQPLILSTCAKPGCHDAIYHKEHLTLIDYNSIRSKALSGELMRYAQFGNSEMRVNAPSSQTLIPLDVTSLSMIQKWINEGAQNSICNNCDTMNVKFSSHISPFIQKNCLGCHSGTALTLLSNYSQIKTTIDNGKLYCAITHSTGCQPMPQGGVKLADCKIRMVKIWIDSGAVNN